MKLTGKCSFFGGPTDPIMKHFEGLAYYEHEEADRRPDLFLPRSTDPLEGTCKRLKNTQSYYIATRVVSSRPALQRSLWKVTNPKTGQHVIASLVDYGPNEKTGRVADLSDAVGRALRIETDAEIEIESINL